MTDNIELNEGLIKHFKSQFSKSGFRLEIIALVVGIAVIFAGILVYALWGHFVIGGLGSSNPIDLVSILSILIIFFGFAILYWFVFRKWELEHGSGQLS